MATSVTSQIQGVSAGLAVKAPVHAVATTNITLSGLQTVGGIVLDGSTLYRVLCTAQTNSVDNGLWDASTGSWSRAKDFDGPRDVVKGTLVPQYVGGTGAFYRVTTANPVIPGTSSIVFEAVVDALSQADLTAIGILSTGVKYEITPAEQAALITIVNEYLRPGELYRYGANTTPGTTVLTTAVQAAIDQYRNGGAPVIMPPEVVISAQLNAFSSAGLDMYIPPSGTLRFAPNQANSQRLLTATGAYILDSATDSKVCRIWGGGTLDGNKDNQGTYTGGEKEQSHVVFLAAASNLGGRLIVNLDDVSCINATGDDIAVYTNVDLTFTNLRTKNGWRSGVSITGGNTRVRGTNLSCDGTPVASSYMADFDIEVDGVGYNSSYRVDIEITNLECSGSFDIGLYSGNNTHGSRVLLTNVNHTGPMANFGCRGSVVKVSNSLITWGPINGSDNRIIWPADLTFDSVSHIFSEGSISATSTFGLDVWFNTGGTTDTNQTLTLSNCKYKADSTVESGDTVVGVFPRAYAAAENNTIVIDGGEFDSTLDDMVRLSAGGKIVVKNNPTVNCARTFNLTFGSTNYWDIKVFGSFNFGAGMTNYAAVDQGNANNVVTHYGTQYDEAFNNITAGGGSPGTNIWGGYRTLYVASAPTAATHGNVGDRAVIKSPAAAGIVEYVCTTQGWGSGAVWKALTTAAA